MEYLPAWKVAQQSPTAYALHRKSQRMHPCTFPPVLHRSSLTLTYATFPAITCSQALEHSSVGAPFQHFLTPLAMLDRLAFGKKSREERAFTLPWSEEPFNHYNSLPQPFPIECAQAP